jgi:hypothetical protein
MRTDGRKRYSQPIKRILLTCDAKNSGNTGANNLLLITYANLIENANDWPDNGLGMRVVGGLELPGSHPPEIGAFVTEILPGGVVDTHGQVEEGDEVLEWNGIELRGRSFEEVQSIISSTRGEVEIVIGGSVYANFHCIPSLERVWTESRDLTGHSICGKFEFHSKITKGAKKEFEPPERTAIIRPTIPTWIWTATATRDRSPAAPPAAQTETIDRGPRRLAAKAKSNLVGRVSPWPTVSAPLATIGNFENEKYAFKPSCSSKLIEFNSWRMIETFQSNG